MHGAFLVVNRWLGPKLNVAAFVSWTITLLATFMAWLSFYELRPDVLCAKLGTLFIPRAYNLGALHEAASHWGGPDKLVLVFMLTLAGIVLFLEWRSLLVNQEAYAILRKPRMLVALIVLTIVLAPGEQNDFIYFAF